MKTKNTTDYLTRDKILNLLSDDEVAAVSTAETAAELADGEEFIDLNAFAHGVQLAPKAKTPMGHVLPKKAVHAGTWKKIVAQLPVASAR